MNGPEILESFLAGRVRVLAEDITKQDVDVIVNAANKSLLGGGGVDGAIHYAGGPQILKECREIRRKRFPKGLPTGEAVLTGGGRLTARYVIHTVGPIVRIGYKPDAEMLACCYQNSLAGRRKRAAYDRVSGHFNGGLLLSAGSGCAYRVPNNRIRIGCYYG